MIALFIVFMSVGICVMDFFTYKQRKLDREDAKRWRELMAYRDLEHIKDEDIRVVTPRPKIEHKGKGLRDVN